MVILSDKYMGLILICKQCGAILGDIKSSDIYGENLVYCPICKFCNTIDYNKNYDGTVKSE